MNYIDSLLSRDVGVVVLPVIAAAISYAGRSYLPLNPLHVAGFVSLDHVIFRLSGKLSIKLENEPYSLSKRSIKLIQFAAYTLPSALMTIFLGTQAIRCFFVAVTSNSLYWAIRPPSVNQVREDSDSIDEMGYDSH